MSEAMKMKILIVAAAIVLGAWCSAPAQQQTPPPHASGTHADGTNGLARIAGELNLTDAQKAQVKEAVKAQVEQARQIRQDTSLTQAQRREKMQAAREQFQAQLRKILTAEQYQKFQKIRTEQHKARSSQTQSSAE